MEWLDCLQQSSFSRLLPYPISLVLIRAHLVLNPDHNLIWNRWMGSRTDSIKQSSQCPTLRAVDTPLWHFCWVNPINNARVSSTVKEHPHPGGLAGRVSPVCLKIARLVSRRQATTIADWNHARLALAWSPGSKWKIYWNTTLPKSPC